MSVNKYKTTPNQKQSSNTRPNILTWKSASEHNYPGWVVISGFSRVFSQGQRKSRVFSRVRWPPWFSYGQLYGTVSRAKSSSGLKVLTPHGIVTNSIVYHEVLTQTPVNITPHQTLETQ